MSRPLYPDVPGKTVSKAATVTVAAFMHHKPLEAGNLTTTSKLSGGASKGGRKMHQRFRYKHFRFVVAAACCLLCFSPTVQQMATVPGDLEVRVGEQTVVPLHLPNRAVVTSSNLSVAHARTVTMHHASDVAVISQDVGDTRITTKLFGFIPWKSVRVHVLPQETVFVGGQSIGVRLHANGVIVVGFQRVGESNLSPAAEAKLQLGDVIEQMNHHHVYNAQDVRRWCNAENTPVQLVVRRGNERRVISIQPITDTNGVRHLGLFVRDKTSGVGTLTFYDPARHRFGALGHVITDADTGQPIHGTGSLYDAEVTGIVPGSAGKPGEKRGRFIAQSTEIGHIEQNSAYGVFGSMGNTPGHSFLDKQMVVALPGQVHEGPAQMLTVLHGQTVQAYEVEIENLSRQEHPGTKSMIVHVVDARLLHEAGGIVQGMSGSPLVQDGKLIGAVTHVFVSDPTRGYGVYAQWMLKESVESEFDDAGEETAAVAPIK
jgi:stage IV sporulation protein B